MTIRFSGVRGALSVAPVRLASTTPLLAALLSCGALLSCSAAGPTPPGGKASGSQAEQPGPAAPAPAALPEGVTETTNDQGEPVFVDMTGNPLPTMMGVDDMGMPTTTITDPNTGMQVPVTPAPTPGGPSGSDMPGPELIVTPEPADELIDDPPPVVSDGELVEGNVCNSAEVMFQPIIPTVMLLIDRSTSMFNNQIPPYVGGSPAVGAYPDRWEALRAAVDLLEPYGADVQFGAMTYTGYNGERVSLDTCPELQGADIPIALDNFAAIQTLLPPSAEAIPAEKSETPTAEGLIAATEALAAVASDGPKYIVLVTDGLPELCGYFDRGAYCGSDPVIGAVQAAYALGIKTFVIGIGFEEAVGDEAAAAEYVLNAAAHAGQGLDVPPPLTEQHLSGFKSCVKDEAALRGVAVDDGMFWNEENWRDGAAATYGATGTDFTGTLYLQPGDDQLGAQLSEVVAGVRSCSFEMEDNVVRDKANLGAVQLTMVDGTTVTLPHGDPNGWDLDAARDDMVVIQGTACTQVQDQDQVQAVRIEFPCEVRIPKAR